MRAPLSCASLSVQSQAEGPKREKSHVQRHMSCFAVRVGWDGQQRRESLQGKCFLNVMLILYVLRFGTSFTGATKTYKTATKLSTPGENKRISVNNQSLLQVTTPFLYHYRYSWGSLSSLNLYLLPRSVPSLCCSAVQQSFRWWQERSLPVLSNVRASSHTWLLSTWNVAHTIKKLKF